MRLVTTPRVTFLRGLADEILARFGRGRVVVTVDGPWLAGKTAFGDDLAAVLAERDRAVFRASMEAFHRSREEQARFGPDIAERYYRFGFDESALRRVLIDPFRMGGSTAFVTAVFDPVADRWVEPKWITGPADAFLVLDGRFLARPSLADIADVRIVLAGEPADAADAIAYAAADPRATASAVVDNADPALPERVG
ncbi:hypothetical protein [Agromyces archimandritae]|uniref:Uridine kinase n=1 Tax=Agromyces archimandritae TaxID=2781962 RepID=A0A975IP04_9MICO|nr:hypothetical protein [Agromyces archimandritae]QTX05105.1 hypothetical protein G127AT_02380 [Agromyces archimandritae]